MATFDVERSPILELLIGVVDLILSSLLFLIPLIYYGKDPIPSIYGINLTGLTMIIWFSLKIIAKLVTDFILRRYYKVNLFNYAFGWIIVCDAIFLLFYTISSIIESFHPHENFPHFLIGFHLIFGFHVIAIYICQNPEKMDKDWNTEQPATPDQVEIQLEEVENANLENPVAMNSEQTCGICLGPKGEVLRTLIPCGHTYFCTECVDKFSKVPDPTCPYCREPITSTMRIRI